MNKKVFTPKCLWCGRKLTPRFKEIRDDAPGVRWFAQKKFKIEIIGYGYMDNGYFCSSGCGFTYAVDLIKHADMTKEFASRKNEIERANEDRGFLASGKLPFNDRVEIGKQFKNTAALKEQDPETFEAIKEHIISNLIEENQND